jgi:hypothetical protein
MAAQSLASEHDLVYLTANGEPGYMKGAGYGEFVGELIQSGSKVAVLCASPISLRAGMSFAEISLHRDHPGQCGQTIKRAKELGIAPILVLVDDGRYDDDELPRLADQFAVDLVLARKLQGEGLATGKGKNNGRTRVWRRNSDHSWYRAIDCYGEIGDLPPDDRVTARLVNEFGRIDEAVVFRQSN